MNNKCDEEINTYISQRYSIQSLASQSNGINTQNSNNWQQSEHITEKKGILEVISNKPNGSVYLSLQVVGHNCMLLSNILCKHRVGLFLEITGFKHNKENYFNTKTREERIMVMIIKS